MNNCGPAIIKNDNNYKECLKNDKVIKKDTRINEPSLNKPSLFNSSQDPLLNKSSHLFTSTFSIFF